MSAGNLSKAELASVSGRARIDAQEAWYKSEGIPFYSRGPDFSALALIEDDEEDGLEGLLILPTAKVLQPGDVPEGLGYPVGGVYALFDENGALNYIGQSCNIAARIIQHRNAARRGERWPFVEYAYVEICSLMIDEVEMAHIYALEPPENAAYGIVRWEHHAEAIKILRAAWGVKSDE
jgi:hypothetical protein